MFDLDQSGYIDGAELKQLGQMRRQLGQKSGVWPTGISLRGLPHHSGVLLSSVSLSGWVFTLSGFSFCPAGVSLSGLAFTLSDVCILMVCLWFVFCKRLYLPGWCFSIGGDYVMAVCLSG